MKISEKLDKLRELMKNNNLSMYYIPTDDYHMSEYVGDYFKSRVFMSGFTGSAGVLLVTLDNAYLWTDGRYFLQAAKQLEGSTINLMKIGEEGVPTVLEFISNYSGKKNLGFDGRTVSASFGEALEKISGISLNPNLDLVDMIWTDRPTLSCEPAYELDYEFSGQERRDKLAMIQDNLVKKNANVTYISSLDDIMWTLNLRGNDVTCNPVVLSYLAVYQDKAILYVNSKALNPTIKANLSKDRIIIRDYNQVYSDIEANSGDVIILDKAKSNYKILTSIAKTNRIIFESNITTLAKACKNKTEVENFRKAHIRDAVAMIKFMYWLKTNVGKIDMSELSVTEYLYNLRKTGKNFKDISFSTIAGFGEHGAIVHYSATEETNAKIVPGNLLLVDSGAHYLEGTTDITRTFALGDVTCDMKHDFTLVLKGYLALSDLIFKEGVNGQTLDLAAREALWREGKDFNHGTGHGVGYLLNVHEGPQNIKYNRESHTFLPGMITSDEPGLYIAGKYGIRHESLILCKEYKKTEFGNFYCFEPITLVPFDLDGIDKSLLTSEEKAKLNAYHKRVYDVISPLLTEKEAKFLKKYTKEI
ncbi:MAG: aminopeptidase P family protein [Acholeplasmatales bacterium]|nr:aminopeptidase P family protein [Acholeplasmatales bacterium]